MNFKGERIACRAAKQSWWIMLWAAADTEMRTCESTMADTPAVGSCRHADEQAWLIQATGGGWVLQPCHGKSILLAVAVCSPAPALHDLCGAGGMHAKQQKCLLLVVLASIHAST